MTWAEFEEKEYESAAFGELMRPDDGGISYAFSAGQVLEKVVGYDVAAAPSPTHVVWRVLQVPRPPGVRLLPSLWAPGRLPDTDRLPQTPVTLVLQFKRPEYLFGATAAQWRFWKQPYFRFGRETEQQRVLYALEQNAGDDAVVRYAAPAFWQRGDLEAAHLCGAVIEGSGFVSPSQLARHRWWTYLRPGIDGRANPQGASARFETAEELLTKLFRGGTDSTELVPSEVWAQHVDGLGEAASRAARASMRREVFRWRDGLLDREPELDSTTVRRIGAIAMLSSVAASVGATWLTVTGLDLGRR